MKALDVLSNEELLETIRGEITYLILKMRAIRESCKDAKEAEKSGFEILPEYKIPDIPSASTPKQIIKYTDNVPVVIGNSFRGKMRRLVMTDFWKRIGISKLQKKVYHMFLTGGNLDQSTQFEDLDKMEKFVQMCPMLGVLGSAIGNMTIKGSAMIAHAYPLCRERGTGNQSYWELLDTIFQTRLDSSKTEMDIEFIDDREEGKEKKDEKAQQMKYEYEVIVDGVRFEHRIACDSPHSIILSAFWHMLDLFNQNPYICGRSSVGCGEIIPDSNLLAQRSKETEYTNYLKQRKVEIKEFWEGFRL